VPDDLYDRDLHDWSRQQAEVLRTHAPGSNIPADWTHIIEELEDLGASQRRALYSHLGTVIEHLLKLRCSPAADPRAAWQESVINAQTQIDEVLAESPSLRRMVPDMIADQMPRQRRAVVRKLEIYGELNPETLAALDSASFTEAQVLGTD
jgi:negative regulator of replication initiation